MFQQFKNIFPNTSLNIRSLTESVRINDTDWNKGIERLGTLRNEFQNLNSFFNRQNSNDKTSTSNTSDLSLTQLEATSQLINTIHNKWTDIHEANQTNFEKAQMANVKLRQLQKNGELHYKVCESMENVQHDLKEMHTNLDMIQNSAVKLMDILSKLEDEIDRASIDYEKQQFEIWKETEEKEFMKEISKKRRLLQERENMLRQRYEEYDELQKKKRLELYEANFNAELEDYRRRRETEVSSLYSYHSMNVNTDEDTISSTLERLDLGNNENELDEFLNDVNEEEGLELQDKKKHKVKSSFIIPKSPILSSSEEDNAIEILGDEDYSL
ncbi:uncharacterized protein BX663DRAFT_523824 [Cokeromyces recurvatus]|uniref:uncharacterized protein n=1 Tax=Cokeromyces recurvatus TaxID=90255 RepID=UPI002220CB02|nr:uncharacterized protein BX663DRAFT_523824 [Cokeromyces recurvatus]KAI7898709.1 hypothetical protein BX663DRAFT_523824 [Cokeromyces recurvatus]